MDRQPRRTGDYDVEGLLPIPVAGFFGCPACDLEVPAGLEETGVLRRTIGGSTHRRSLQPGLLSEAADWTGWIASAPVGRLFDVVDEYLREDRPR